MALKKFLKGIAEDVKKAAKGSKEYQKGKAKRKAKRAKSPLGKAAKQVAKDVKSAVKGSKEYQAAKAKKKAGKAWTKAVKRQKKGGSGETLSSLVSKRKGLKKGSAEYAAVQNKINKAYGSKVRHKAEAPKKAAPKKVAPKKVAPKKATPSGPESPVGKKEYEAKPGQKSTMQRNKPKRGPEPIQPYPPREDQGPKFAEGGKVESNPYGWPTRDARGRK